MVMWSPGLPVIWNEAYRASDYLSRRELAIDKNFTRIEAQTK